MGGYLFWQFCWVLAYCGLAGSGFQKSRRNPCLAFAKVTCSHFMIDEETLQNTEETAA